MAKEKEKSKAKTGEIYHKKLPHYGRLSVFDTTTEGDPVRLLLVDNVRESAMYLEPEKKNEPVFKYQKRLRMIFDDRPDILNTLLIGGAGFTFPRVYLNRYPEKSVDVVELMPQMEKIAQKYFDLEELPRDRMNIHIIEAMKFLEHSDKVYDAVLNDAFIGDRMDKGLQSDLGIKLVRDHLRPEGLYVINVLTELFGTGAIAAKQFRDQLQQNFEYTLLLRTRDDVSIAERQNFILLASDGDLEEYVRRNEEIPF